MTNSTPADLDVKRTKTGSVSAIWLVPLIALAISLFIGWNAYSSRGPLIQITFENGDGLVEDSTELRFREVKVGVVEDIRFADDMREVIVSVRLEKDVAQYVDNNASFWIVRPQVSARGISGLTTVLSGVYIEGVWDAEKGPTEVNFAGLDARPLITGAEQGIEFVLSAPDAGRVLAGAPIVYKGVTVGFIAEPELTENGEAVTAHGFVKAPHDRLITTATRFWSASGFSVNLGAGGLSFSVANLAALVQGGTSFSSFGSGGQKIEDGHVFSVFEDENAARNAWFESSSDRDVPFVVLFDDSVSGLAADAPVEFKGLKVGTVTGLGSFIESEADAENILLRTDITLQPSRLGLPDDTDKAALEDFIEELVREGYRARLASQGLLGTSLKVEIVKVDDAPEVEISRNEAGVLILPSTAPSLSDVAESAKGALKRLDDLPIEDFVQSAVDLVTNVNRLIGSPEIQEVPQDVAGLIKDIRDLVSSDAVQTIPREAGETIAGVRSIVTRIEEGEALKSLIEALERSNAIAQSIQTTAEGLPELLGQIETLAATAVSLPLQELLESARKLVTSAESVVASDDIAAIPAELRSTLGDVGVAVANVRVVSDRLVQSEALDNLIAALARTDSIAKSIDDATAELPELMNQIEQVANTAADLPLEQLVNSANSLVQSADALVSSEDTAQIPAALASALDEVGLALAELREGGAVQNANEALASASSAAQAVEDAAASLPALSQRLESLVSQGESLMATYGGRSEFNTQTLAVLRDLRETARSVTALARAIERKPNSLLIGR